MKLEFLQPNFQITKSDCRFGIIASLSRIAEMHKSRVLAYGLHGLHELRSLNLCEQFVCFSSSIIGFQIRMLAIGK